MWFECASRDLPEFLMPVIIGYSYRIVSYRVASNLVVEYCFEAYRIELYRIVQYTIERIVTVLFERVETTTTA